jgi:hypothetical protein
MADTVHIGENSAEEVAFKLLRLIREYEGDSKKNDRNSILNLYAECLNAVRNPHVRVKLN